MIQLLQGDCLQVLRTLPGESVHCCITSPPYYGLRRYLADDDPNKPREIGLEQSPEEYVAKLVQVFREVRRVLRRDGTLWLNLGDSYAGYHGNSRVPDGAAPSNKPGYVENMRDSTVGVSGLKPKDLIGIPWMVAFALQADGWWLRQDIVWAKAVSGSIRRGSVMPESVRDRFCKSHEYVFLLSKSPRYYFDSIAVADKLDNHETHEHSSDYENEALQQVQDGEAVDGVQQEQPARRWPNRSLQILHLGDEEGLGPQVQPFPQGAGGCCTLLQVGQGTASQEGLSAKVRANGRTTGALSGGKSYSQPRGEAQSSAAQVRSNSEGEAKQGPQGQAIPSNCEGAVCEAQDRDKAKISARGNRLHNHHGSMGTDQGGLQPTVCILRDTTAAVGNGPCATPLAGRSARGTEHCSGLSNVQRQERQPNTATRRDVWLISPKPYRGAHFATFPPDLVEPMILAGCPGGGTVLDPFMGSGTTLAVAVQHGRSGIGIELNPDYIELAKERIAKVQPPLL